MVSLALMIGIGYKIDNINTQKYESIVLQKYLLDGRKIFTWMATAPASELKEKFLTLNLVKTAPVSAEKVIMQQLHTFGLFEILKVKDGDYVMHLRYMDEDIFLRDTTLYEAQKDGWILNALVIADTLTLVVIFMIILHMLSPLSAIAGIMRQFATGEYGSRSAIESNDEIGRVASAYNEMAQTIENLINSREELLRDVGHELRTPITRGLFALEQIEPSKAKETLKRSFLELEQLTGELLEIEKLHATDNIKSDSFSAETLVLEALSRLSLFDESVVSIEIRTNFTIKGDLVYLALALKNILENGLKYSDKFPIFLEVTADKISVRNHGKALEREFSHYLVPFTREESSRTSKGFGLGLNIISKIIAKHGFLLAYDYEEGYHNFSIVFN